MNEREVPHELLYTPHLEILDVDKTLIDTRGLQRTLEADAELHGIDSDKLRYDRARTSGFDTVQYLRDVMKVSETQLADIKGMFLEQVRARGSEAFLLPGAKETLDVIVSRRIPHMLLTTGGGEWQNWKLDATGLLVHPHHITSGRRKGELITYGYDPESGLYIFNEVEGLGDGLTGYAFENFRIVDDNEQAFINLPLDASGFFVAHNREQWEENMRNPSIAALGNVAICYGLDEYRAGLALAA
jgi:hypothetical protein